MGKTSFLQKLKAAAARNNSLLCFGLDPVPARLPEAVMGKDNPVLYFNKKLIDATADLVCAYKPNFAFYGALGEAGWPTLKATLEHIPSHIPVLVDAKVGDIGSTAERYAHMFFGELGADALTVNPYMGSDAVAPFLEYSTGALEASERCVFLICLTSNPGAEDFETLPVDGCPLYRRVAEKAVEWSAIAPCGLVVGATRPQAIRGLRELAPELPFLIPGVGTQGGDLESAVQQGQLASGGGLLINASRGVMYASSGPDFESAARHAAHTLRAEINRFRSP